MKLEKIQLSDSDTHPHTKRKFSVGDIIYCILWNRIINDKA